MNKIAFALAVGAIAAGVSAQATEVSSAEYAVITIPVTAGNNLIGVSVVADKVAVSTLTDITSTKSVKTWTGNAYSTATAAGTSLSTGEAFWYNAEENGVVYQIGVAPAETASVGVPVGGSMDIVAPPFAKAWSLDDITFSTEGSSRISGANKVHVWNGTGYDTYWYKATTGAKAGWYLKGNSTKLASLPTLGAAQAVFVELGSGTSGTVTFAAE